MTIEFGSLEEIFKDRPDLIPMEKGLEPLPPLTVKEFRAVLRGRLAKNDCPDPDEIAKVNVFERMKLMQQKSRDLLDHILKVQKMPDEKMIEKYDYLAIDWVYSDQLEWAGSLADKEAEKIKAGL